MAGRRFDAGLFAALIAIAFVLAEAVFAHSDDIEDQDPGYGMGYGMEPDTMDEYCPGCGMLGGASMTGRYGVGPGNFETGAISALELDSEQKKQMARIDTALRKQNWSLQGEIIDAQGELFELYADEPPDPKKIGAVYGKIFDLRRQMIEAAIEAQNRQRAILNDEQREKLRKGPYGGRNGDYLRNYDGMGHHHRHHMTGH